MEKVSADLLQQIKQKIVAAIQPEKIVLFGSYAWGKPTESSDIDLFIIVADTGQPSYKKAREVYRALRGINIPIDVVVQTFGESEDSRRVVTSLTRKVMDEGVVLYG